MPTVKKVFTKLRDRFMKMRREREIHEEGTNFLVVEVVFQ